MTRAYPETPNLRWFKAIPTCKCGRKATGELMGVTNESYGFHCNSCANKRLKMSEKVRNQLVAERSV